MKKILLSLRNMSASIFVWALANKALAATLATLSLAVIGISASRFNDAIISTSTISTSQNSIFGEFVKPVFNSSSKTSPFGEVKENAIKPTISPFSPTPDGLSYERSEDCFSLGRVPRNYTNIGRKDLKVYPNPNEKISGFYVQWHLQSWLIEADGRLTKYMFPKINEIYPGAKAVRLLDRLGLNKNRDVWQIELPVPVSLGEFAERVDAALVLDRKIFTSKDPDADYKRHARCQIELIEPIRVAEAMSWPRLTYNDPSVRLRDSNGENQSDIDDADPSSWAESKPMSARTAVSRSATDVFSMHRNYEAASQLPGDKQHRSKVDIAIIDGSGVVAKDIVIENGMNPVGIPKLAVLEDEKLPYDKTLPFSHANTVMYRLAGFSNDGLYNAGVIPNDVLNNYSNFMVFNTRLKDNGQYYFDGRRVYPVQMMTILGGGKVRDFVDAGCGFYNCFFTNYIENKGARPDIINYSMSIRAEALALKEAVNIDPVAAYEKFGCGGSVTRALLNSREHRAPIIAALGNNPQQIAQHAVDCAEHVIGVAGAAHPGDWIARSGELSYWGYGIYYDELSSSTWGLAGNFVASSFHAYIAKSEKDATTVQPAVIGTSFAAPVITGTAATLLSMVDNPQLITAPNLYRILANSGDLKMIFRPTDLRASMPQAAEKGVPFINSDCALRHFMRVKYRVDFGQRDFIPFTCK